MSPVATDTSKHQGRKHRGRVRPGLLLALATAGSMVGIASARADETLFATVAGFQILRSDDRDDKFSCRLFRQYKNPEDGDKVSAIATTPKDHSFVMSVVFGGWHWTKDQKYITRLSVDKQLIAAKQLWYSADTALAAGFAETLLPKFAAGRRLVLGFTDGDRAFDLSGFKAAYDATVKCDGAPRAEAPSASAAPAPAPVPAPTPPAAAPPPAAPAPPAASTASASDTTSDPSDAATPAESRAVAYALGLVEAWAIDGCDMRSTRKDRDALAGRQAALRAEMASIEPELAAVVTGMKDGGKGCPPTADLENVLRVLAAEAPDEVAAKVDRKVAREFLSMVRPLVARRDAPPPAAAAVGPATPQAGAGPAGGDGTPRLPDRARLAAYVLGLDYADLVARCDIATSGRQRGAMDAMVKALRPEMAPVEAMARDAVEKGTCPGPADQTMIADVMSLVLSRTPEDFATEADKRMTGRILPMADEILSRARRDAAATAVPTPRQAWMAAYMFGLGLQDAIARCDIRSTGRQRDALAAKMAMLKTEVAAVETALREQMKARGDACPTAEVASSLEGALPLLIEETPEDFAAEMDRQAAARHGAEKP